MNYSLVLKSQIWADYSLLMKPGPPDSPSTENEEIHSFYTLHKDYLGIKLLVNSTSAVTFVGNADSCFKQTNNCLMASLLLWSSDRNDQDNWFIIREWQCLRALDGGWTLDP
jgi:hypothetical protein